MHKELIHVIVLQTLSVGLIVTLRPVIVTKTTDLTVATVLLTLLLVIAQQILHPYYVEEVSMIIVYWECVNHPDLHALVLEIV